jgi:hypothetical protein
MEWTPSPTRSHAEPPAAQLVAGSSPRWVFAGRPGPHEVAWLAAAALSFAAALLLPFDRPPLSLFACPFRAATGWPCPSCGATHAVLHLARGELLASLLSSPLFSLGAVLFWGSALLVAARALGLRRTLHLPAPSAAGARRLRVGALGLLLANWAFVALRIAAARGGS